MVVIPSTLEKFYSVLFKDEKQVEAKIITKKELEEVKDIPVYSYTNSPNIEVSYEALVNRYISNPITSAIVCGGLEPFDSWPNLHSLVQKFRERTEDDIVIYTGYNREEIEDAISTLSSFKNIIIKFGRFIPNQESHFDEVLGVKLASPNQYAERIS